MTENTPHTTRPDAAGPDLPAESTLIVRAESIAGAAASGSAPLPTIGPYRILRELGSGGMGTVYLAEDLVLHRQVAVKLLPRGCAHDGEMRLRFQREAEVASRLDHPHLCGVIAVGEADRQLWIAMRFVPGRTLRDVMRDHDGVLLDSTTGSATRVEGERASWRNAVALVETLARAVHFAHEAGVVHCDLKPANVMVTPDGAPVILDFGLAHDIRDALGEGLTRTGQLLGTPHYMAPEQVRASGDRGDRRIDVWALGVILYELLTRNHPFEAPTRELLYQRILQQDPPAPGRFARRLPRDLSVVVATALEKDSGRRYATALALADDLRAVLDIRAIVARPAGFVSRIAKFARRRPAAAALAVLLIVGLPGIGTLVTLQAVNTRRVATAFDERVDEVRTAIARRQPARARLALVSAAALVPESLALAPLRVDLDRQEALLEAETLALDPDTDPDGRLALTALGRVRREDPASARAALLTACVLERVGRGAEAADLMQRFATDHPSPIAAEVARWFAETPSSQPASMPTTTRPATALSSPELELARALLISARGRHSEALEILERLLEADPAAHWLAWVAAEEATRLQDSRAALAFAGRHRAAAPLDTPGRLGRYSVHLRRAGLIAEAERAATDAEAMARGRYHASGAEPREWAVALEHLAAARADAGQRTEAIRLLQQALSLMPDFPEAWNSLATIYVEERRYAEAVDACRRAIALMPGQFDARVNLGSALMRLLHDEEARAVLEEAVRMRQDSPLAWSMLANARRNQRDFDGALAAANRALELKPAFPEALAVLGSIHHVRGEKAQAERRYREALDGNPRFEPALFNLALLLHESDPNASIGFYRRVLLVHPERPDAMLNLSVLLNERREHDEALRLALRLVELTPDDPKAWNCVGSVHSFRGDLDGAVAAFRRAVECPAPLPESHLNLLFVLVSKEPVAAWLHGREAFAIRPALAATYAADFQAAKDAALEGFPEHVAVVAAGAAAADLPAAERVRRAGEALRGLKDLPPAPRRATEALVRKWALQDLREAARLASDADLTGRVLAEAARGAAESRANR